MIAHFIKSTVLVGSLIVVVSLPLRAAPSPGTTGHGLEVKPKPVKVTGCLQKGDEENEFVLTNKAGKKYEITSKSVALAGHVGHTVTVRGTAVAEEEQNEAKEEKGEKEEANEYAGGHVQVTRLTMVSAKCH